MGSSSDIEIRPAGESDAAALAAIYNHYIDNTVVTFETDRVGARQMGQRVKETAASSLPWLVAVRAGQLVGFAYASRWKGRCAYRYSVESTVYLDHAETGRGLGAPLYGALIEAIRAEGMHSVIAGIALPNDASIKLHERLGFIKIGQFAEVGNKFDRWIDVGYWQLNFDA